MTLRLPLPFWSFLFLSLISFHHKDGWALPRWLSSPCPAACRPGRVLPDALVRVLVFAESPAGCFGGRGLPDGLRNALLCVVAPMRAGGVCWE